MIKRYLLFTGEFYYARGGWHDSPWSFDSREEAVEGAKRRVEHGHEWWHVVDLMNMCIVAKSDQQAYGAD